MAKVIEPFYSEEKLAQTIEKENAKTILLIFWHGLGDLIMFLEPYNALRKRFPDKVINLAVQKGLSFEDIVPHAETVDGSEMDHLDRKPYDIVAKIHFPMSEGQTVLTKGEFCCVHELGIPPVWGHRDVPAHQSRLIGVHFNITCLPDSCNPDEATARRIWQDIKDAGFIPIETHFEHVFHNPVNKKFDFVDCTVRGAPARIRNLVGLMNSLAGFVGVVSGNFHLALATLPSNRIFFLQKHFQLECFTRLPIARASIMPDQYQGEVKPWLNSLDQDWGNV